MFLSDLKSASRKSPLDLAPIANTLQFRDKLSKSRELIHRWLAACSRPYISCGGGKDSTATALLVRTEDDRVPIVCAHPPNPIPGRDEHVTVVRQYFGEPWIDMPYPWNVDAVLDGSEKYPESLKIKMLNDLAIRYNFDGLAMGLRASESNGRRILAAVRGDLYNKKDGTKICLPVLRWTADEVLALAASTGAPINPIYINTHLMPSYEVIRDGTWWPHLYGFPGEPGYRAWLSWYYPQLIEKYDMAIRLQQ
jgi:hypothetical protein